MKWRSRLAPLLVLLAFGVGWVRLESAPSPGPATGRAGPWTWAFRTHCFPPDEAVELGAAQVPQDVVALSSQRRLRVWQVPGAARQVLTFVLPSGAWVDGPGAYRRVYYRQLREPQAWLRWLTLQGPLLDKRCWRLQGPWPESLPPSVLERRLAMALDAVRPDPP